METFLHRQIVMLSHCYMEYVQESPHFSSTAGGIVSRSAYVRTVDYSDVVDACLEDLPEGKYL